MHVSNFSINVTKCYKVKVKTNFINRGRLAFVFALFLGLLFMLPLIVKLGGDLRHLFSVLLATSNGELER